jgi:hypothetical protein
MDDSRAAVVVWPFCKVICRLIGRIASDTGDTTSTGLCRPSIPLISAPRSPSAPQSVIIPTEGGCRDVRRQPCRLRFRRHAIGIRDEETKQVGSSSETSTLSEPRRGISPRSVPDRTDRHSAGCRETGSLVTKHPARRMSWKCP